MTRDMEESPIKYLEQTINTISKDKLRRCLIAIHNRCYFEIRAILSHHSLGTSSVLVS
jgi:hypothetical protein